HEHLMNGRSRLAPLSGDQRLALGDGKREGEAGAALGPILGPDATALCFDEATRYRQAKARTAARARTRGVAAPEAFEHPLLRFLREPDARVLDRHLEHASAPSRTDDDRAIRWGVPQRIGDEIEEHALHMLGRAADV